MKTGGTMNFLKRAGAILMVVAIFASSCNKYADDFDQLNKKIDALATSQGTSFTQLTSDVASIKSSIATMQTAIAALPTATQQTAQFAAVTAQLTAMTGQITSLDTQVKAITATGNATAAAVAKVQLDLTALAAKVTADNATIIANQATSMAKLNAMDVKIDGLTTKLTTLQATSDALVAAVAKVQTGVDANSLGIAALATKLNDQATEIAKIGTDLTANSTAATAANDAAVAAALASAASDASLLAGQSTILTKIADLNTAMALDAKTGTSTDTATSLTMQGLQLQLAAMTLQLNNILTNQVVPLSAVAITGTAQVGSKLTANPTPIGAKADYQWYQGSTAIAGATGTTYTPVAADLGKTIKVKATGKGNNLSAELESSATTAVIDQTPLLGVTITGVTAQVGNLLYVDPATSITPSTTAVSYKWQISPTLAGTYTDIAGATKASYNPVAGDATQFIRVAVTGTGGFTGTVYSAPTSAVIYPQPLVSINAITGGTSAQVGVELVAGATTPAQPTTANAAKGYPAVATYQWQSTASLTAPIVWTNIPGATSSKYTPVAGDLNMFLQVVATGVNYVYGTAASAPTSAVIYPVILSGTPVISNAPAVGTALTVTGLVGTATYDWQSAAAAAGPWYSISGSSTTSGTYTPVAGDVGKFIKVVCNGTSGFFGTLTSNTTGAAVVTANIQSLAFNSAAGANNVTVTLTGGTFNTTISGASFLFGGANTGVLSAGTVKVTRVSSTVAVLTNVVGMALAIDNTVTVLSTAMATQATSVAGVAAIVTPLVSTAIAPALTVGQNTLTVTLVGGTWKGAATSTAATNEASLLLTDVSWGGADAGILGGAGVTYKRVNATTLLITGFEGISGVNDILTIPAASMASQATSVVFTPGTNGFTTPTTAGVVRTASTTTTITLTSGTFKAGTILPSDFTFAGGTVGDAALVAAGAVTAQTTTSVTITHIALTAAGPVMTATVKASVQATQAVTPVLSN